MAILVVFDDGRTDGEIIRIRDHRFIIGRSEGDLVIPFDGRISAATLRSRTRWSAGCIAGL